MKILDKIYPVKCPNCETKNLVTIPTKKDGEMKQELQKCPKCKKDVEFKVIGSVDMIDENGLIDFEHGKFIRMHFFKGA